MQVETAIQRLERLPDLARKGRLRQTLHAGRLPDRREQVDGNGEPDEAKVSSPVWRGGVGCSL